MKILLAIPCYNCEKQVSRVFKSLEELAEFSQIESALFIDNRSLDGTTPSLLALKKKSIFAHKMIIARNEENYGLGGTHKVAFQYAIAHGFDAVLILHGDDQANTSDIPEMILRAQKKQTSVLGSRFLQESTLENYSLSRILGNRVLNVVFTMATLRPTYDLGSGLNLFITSDLARIPFLKLSDSFNFNVELLLEFYRHNIQLEFMPIHWRETDQTSNARNFNVAFRMLGSLRKWLEHAPHQSAQFKQYATQLLTE
jgi:glycosyltransferase involved in cell wall biosynthesis